MREPDTVAQTFVMYFQGSLRGLSVGAPVDLSGINIGEVKHLSVEYDRDAGLLRFPVEVDIFPQRIRGRPRTDRGAGRADDSDIGGHAMIDSMVAHGMRAELKTGSLLTGQKFVSVEVEKRPAARSSRLERAPADFSHRRGRTGRDSGLGRQHRQKTRQGALRPIVGAADGYPGGPPGHTEEH